ncbi:GDSL-type esterase/lipase family protein [Streptomyces sp. NPDC050988]|uniref:GDSL-type esterase/lipase family protein n=1 Tax=Streptomyces sp. NPDC050988 TaxID=3365637 RepID=UPI0037BCD338
MTEHITDDGLCWRPTWAQAMSDFRGEDGEDREAPFDDVTVRMTVPAGLGGTGVRVELSNRFGDEPVVVGRGAVGVGGRFHDLAFNGQPSTRIPAGETLWTDPVELTVHHGDDVVVDVYLPSPTPYETGAGFRFDRSRPGDHAGSHPFPLEGTTPEGSIPEAVDESRDFPAANTDTGPEPEPDGTGWSLPAGGPFLRTIEVVGSEAKAVIVALGSSSTAMGWPQYTAGLLPADARISVVNRGISGNRIRLDAPLGTPSWGRSGLSRFDEDVLETAGVTHVVIAYNSNDWGLPGRITSRDEMPTVAQLTDAYQELVDRAQKAGLQVILATITAHGPELRADPEREDIRRELNDWIRTSGHPCVDFDAAIRSATDPSRLDAAYAAPDATHPNINGEKRLAQTVVDALASLHL